MTGPSDGSTITVMLERGKVLDVTIWRLVFIDDEEHQIDAGPTVVPIQRKLQAENPDPDAVKIYDHDEALPDAAWAQL
jgi:hypothetical protein